jgi:RND family efflux transporter MFP subunit
VALCLSLAACGGGGRPVPAGEPAPRAAAAPPGNPAKPAAGEDRQGYLGVLLAREAVDVAAETAGRLTSVDVRAGDVVERGALVATLDTQLAGQDLEAARAVLRQAQIEEEKSAIALADAEGRLARRQSFPEAFPKEEILAAQNQRDAARAAVEGARARVREQRARVAQYERMMARAEVRAPFAGIVGVRYLDAGATVGAGMPIVRIVGARGRLVRFAVPEEERRRIAPGQAVRIVPRGSSAELRGTVEKIAPEVDAASGMVLVEARIDSAGDAAGAPQPGEVVRVLPAPS